MVDQLASFADEVTRVAREVGTEGKLGGQAEVEGVSGTWRDLTENVNQLAGNLTTQVRAIAEVSTAVTQGDLTRSITVEAAGRGRRAQGQHQPDDRQPARDDAEQRRAGLAEDEPGPDLGHAPGPARPRARCRQLIMCELTPLVNPAARRVLPGRAGEADRPAAGRRLRLPHARASPTASRSATASSARRRSRRKPILSTDVPERLHADLLGARRGAAAHLIVMPILFEEQVLGVIELGVAAAVQRRQPGLPRPAHRHDRRRPQHDPANMRTEELLSSPRRWRRSCRSIGGDARTTNDELAGEDARCLQQQNRDIEIKNAEIELARARPGGEGRAARAVLEVQVGVPGQHEPRAADAAELAADPLANARREPRRQPHRAAGRVRHHDPRRGQRPARADQRHPRPVQGRGGQDGARPRAGRAVATCATTSSARSARWPSRRACVRHRASTPRCRRRSSPTSSACSRCCATCCPTRSSSPTGAVRARSTGSRRDADGARWHSRSPTPASASPHDKLR